jgi:hypothetical protein
VAIAQEIFAKFIVRIAPKLMLFLMEIFFLENYISVNTLIASRNFNIFFVQNVTYIQQWL